MARRRKTGGRETKLTPQVHATIIKHVKNGTPQKYAAQAAGIKEPALRKWISRGRQEKSGIYFDFVAALKEAEGDFVASNVKVVQRAADGVIETTLKETIGPPTLVPESRNPDGEVIPAHILPGLVLERVKTTRKVYAWAAAAWLLERRAQQDFSNAKSELQLLKKQLVSTNEKLKALLDAQQSGSLPTVEAAGTHSEPVPQVGGDAKPDAI